ncbi:putative glutathione S-transferase [Acephala macrosclerotiorum]|nr:putative glutathione S-transferase [Acephala macrosclerotiorum]
MSQLILYDLPSKDPRQCWSYNPWKTRLVLNYKNLDYKTVWTEYPDIEATLKDHVPPNPEGQTPYTIPAMQFSDGTYIMDSKAIATRLEKDHPTPSLHLDSPILEDLARIGNNIMMPLQGIRMLGVYENVLPPRSKEYFGRTREARVGKPLLQLKKETDVEEAWMEALPGIKALGEMLKKNGGPFVEGDTPTYADFVIVGWLQFLKVIGEDLYQRLVKVDPAIGNLYDASRPWLERNDH